MSTPTPSRSPGAVASVAGGTLRVLGQLLFVVGRVMSASGRMVTAAGRSMTAAGRALSGPAAAATLTDGEAEDAGHHPLGGPLAERPGTTSSRRGPIGDGPTRDGRAPTSPRATASRPRPSTGRGA